MKRPTTALIMKKLLLLALVAAVPLFGQGAGKDAPDDFSSRFFEDANLADYVARIDALIDAGEAAIYASQEAETAAKDHPPQAKTGNGVFMIYTVTHTPAGVLAHFSVSRPPYLATNLGKDIVSLFMIRSGWPKPTQFSVSQNQVFHAVWLVPEADFARIREMLPKARGDLRKDQPAKSAMLKAVLGAANLEAASMQVGPSAPPARGGNDPKK